MPNAALHTGTAATDGVEGPPPPAEGAATEAGIQAAAIATPVHVDDEGKGPEPDAKDVVAALDGHVGGRTVVATAVRARVLPADDGDDDNSSGSAEQPSKSARKNGDDEPEFSDLHMETG